MIEKHLKLKDFDFVEQNGNIYRILGNIHPPGSYVVLIRYILDEVSRKYLKAKKYGTTDQDPSILKLYGNLLREIPWYGIKSGMLTPKGIRAFFPNQFFSRLVLSSEENDTKKSVLNFSRYLMNTLGISQDNLGINGSILLGLGTSTSDIDILVYGKENSRELFEHFDILTCTSSTGYSLVGWDRSMMARRFLETVVSPNANIQRLSNRLRFSILEKNATKIDIHYVESNNPEQVITPPEILRRSIFSKFTGIVKDTSDSCFFPGTVELDQIRPIDAAFACPMDASVLFTDKRFQFLRKHDRITFKGQLLRIVPRQDFLKNADEYIVGRELLKCRVA